MLTNYTLLELPYQDDFIDHYAALADLPGFVLLESGDKVRGRYDIVSAYPYARYTCCDYGQISDYLALLEQVLPSNQSVLDLPFQGGLMGYFSYDLAAGLMGVPVTTNTSLNNAQRCLADFGLYDWAFIIDHRHKTVSLFSANQDANSKDVISEVLIRWQQAKTKTANTPLIVGQFNPLINGSDYYESFQAIWHALDQGRCYQVNYTQPFIADYLGDTWSIYRKIRVSNPVPFAAYVRGHHEDLVSFSPERFLAYNARHLLTSPIKGTVKRSNEDALDRLLQKDLSHSEKNRAENTMIVDLLRNDLSRIAEPGTVQVTALCQLQSYRSVHHLVSSIEAVCRLGISPLTAFLSCFPGGSITGAPKLEAMHVISEQEVFARAAYCGSIAYFSAHGRFDSSITIRTLIAQGNQLSLSAGGGIVIDSQCDEEYAECLVKIKSLRDTLCL